MENKKPTKKEDSAMFTSGSAESQKPLGQMAKNYSNPLKAQVDTRTRSLAITFEPPVLKGRALMDLNLGITYTQSASAGSTSLFGLPYGWSFFLSYILDDHIVINGTQSYKLQSTNDVTGMEYFKAKNLKLDFDGGTLPYSYKQSSVKKYSRKLIFLDGHNQYFDVKGKLICYDDKWGNHQLFYYDDDDKPISGAKLVEVITTEGKSVRIKFPDRNKKEILITVYYPTDGKNSIEFSYRAETNLKLTGYINPINDITDIEYDGGGQRNLISKITYPSGLTKEYSYTKMTYLNNWNDAFLEVVSKVKSTYLSDERTVTYSFSGDKHNYLGYGYPELSVETGNEDPLFKSENNNYIYSTIVDDGITKTTHDYNWLNLELSSNVKTIKGKLVTESSTFYILNSKGNVTSNFPYFANLPDNYQFPKEQLTTYYNDEGKTRSTKITSEYDDFGNQIREVLYDGNNDVYKETLSEYDTPELLGKNNNYGVLVNQTVKDYMSLGVISPINPSITTTKNELNADKLAIKVSLVGAFEGVAFSPEKTTTFAYDRTGSITSEQLTWTNSAGNQGITQTGRTYTYEADYSIKNTIDAEGNQSTENYDLSTGFLLSKVDALGNTESYDYDNLGRIISQKDAVGKVTSYSYFTPESKMVTTYQNGYITVTYFNGFEDCIKKTDFPIKGGSERTIEESTFNNLGQLESKSGVLGDNSKLEYTYNNRGLLKTETDAQENELSYVYNSVDQTKQTSFNRVKTTEETFNIQEKVIQSRKFDLTEGPLEMLTTKSYNALGLNLKTENWKDSEKWMIQDIQYDIFENPIKKIASGFDSTEKTTEMTLDLLNNVLNSTVLSTQPNSLKNSSTNVYNKIGERDSETTPLNKTKKFWYDAVGNLTKSDNFKGESIHQTFTYDNKLDTKTYLDENSNEVIITYTYDENRNLISSIKQSNLGTISYDYSLDGQLEKLSFPDGKQLKWGFDANGFLDLATDVKGNETRYHYDAYGRIINMSNEQLSENVTIAYYSLADDAYSGKIKSVTYSNGIQILYSYSPFNWVSAIQITNSAGENLLSVTYEHDIATGNITKIGYRSNKSTGVAHNHDMIYEYNGINQLASDQKKSPQGSQLLHNSYVYDAAGNILSKTSIDENGTTANEYIYDGDNQLATIKTNGNTVNLDYDGNGNLIVDDEGNIYNYNVLNQLISFTSESKIHTVYTYYATGLRATKKVDMAPIITYYYDNEENANIVNELQAGTAASYLMNGNNRYCRVYSEGSTTSTEYLLQNDKDVLMVMDSAGEIQSAYSYAAYGESESLVEDTSIKNNPFMYNKEYCDFESKLYYLRSRYYAPHLMCFTTYDSIIIFNHYNFASGNPIMNVDPTGHFSFERLMAIEIGIASIALGVVITGGSGATASVVGGALIGAGTSGIVYAATTSDDNYNWTSYTNSVAIGAIAGAVGGGVTSGFGPTASIGEGILVGAIAGAASGTTSYLVESAIEGDRVTGSGIERSFAIGGVSGGLGGAAGSKGEAALGSKIGGRGIDSIASGTSAYALTVIWDVD
jgi:RHS repeat-associated protein